MRVKTCCLVLKSWLCNKGVVFWGKFTDEIGMYDCSVRFYEECKNKIRLLIKLKLDISRY